MNYNEDQYYEKIKSTQQSLYKREQRRHELERELFVHCRSDKRILQIKCSKLRCYLREISEREERAKRRNFNFMKDAEHIENSMKTYQPNQDLPRLKVKVMQRQYKSLINPVNTPTVLGVTGQQTKDGLPSAISDHILQHSPEHVAKVHEPLQRGLLRDSKVGLDDAVGNQAYLTDDISSSNNTPYVCNLRGEHEKTTVDERNLTSPSEEHELLHPLTLTVPEEKKPSFVSGSTIEEKPGADKMDPTEFSAQPPRKEEEKSLVPESAAGKTCLGSPGSFESSISSEINLTGSKSSALSISLTQSELDEDLPESEASDKCDSFEETDNQYQHNPKSSLHQEQSAKSLESLSQRGLYKFLDAIEGHLHDEQSTVYSDPSISTKELYRLISLCNSGGDLNSEDPNACGAVVLHELQRLSWSTGKGCLLPPDVVNAQQTSTVDEISACLPPDAAQLWDRWFKHALLLKRHSVLSTEHLVQLFTPLLLKRHAANGHQVASKEHFCLHKWRDANNKAQAKVLLRTLLSRSSEECPSVEDKSDGSSFGPAPPSSRGAVRPLLNQHSPELQSSEEDSEDESPVESVPIRESKAYQLLKQSAMQKQIVDSDGEEGNKEGRNANLEEDKGRAKHQDHYSRMEETNSKVSSALQSKAFWGDSDDSNSEIEAALRPQPFNQSNADTDVFYS